MGYYSKLLVAAIEKGIPEDQAKRTLQYIAEQNQKADAAKQPFAVHTRERDITGLPPYIVWGISRDSVASRFQKAYKVLPTKIVPAEFDGETGKWIEKP